MTRRQRGEASEGYRGDPAELCVGVQAGVAFTVGLKLDVSQVENASDDPKQMLNKDMHTRIGTHKWCGMVK